MNQTARFEEVVFTDNLCKAYRNYQTLKDHGWCAKNQTQYIKSRLDRFRTRVNELREAFFKQVKKEESKDQCDQTAIATLQEAFKLYFEAHNTAKMLDFDGSGFYMESRQFNLNDDSLWAQAIENKDNNAKAFEYINLMAYSQVSLMGDLRPEWDIRCHDRFLDHVVTLVDEELEVLLFYISMISRGLLFLHKHIGVNQGHQNWVADPKIAYSILFCEAFTPELGIVGSIMPERVPVANPQKEGLREFVYRQYVQLNHFWDLTSIIRTGRNYQYHISDALSVDPDRYEAFKYSEVNLRHDINRGDLQVHVQFKHLFSGDFITYLIKPLKIFKWMLKEPALVNMKFDKTTRRWIYNPGKVEDPQQDTKQQIQAQNKVLQQMDKEQTSKKLVQILDLMPTLSIKLSKLQQKVVASNQNLLCLGRSGTGKTTTSVLRLFAQEVLYSILKKQQNKMESRPKIETPKLEDGKVEEEQQPKKKKQLIKAEDLEKSTGMKMVFITASPVLTNEVRRFYSNIKGKLIYFLKQRDERIKAKKAQLKDVSEQEAIEIVEQVIKEQEEEERAKATSSVDDLEKKEMLEFMRTEERSLMDDLQLEHDMQLPNSFDELQSSQFPLFVTVKRLVYMMDACLNFSFFSRDYNNNIIGLDANLGWHNEAKGVMMINHYFKESIDYDAQLAKFGKDLLELDKELEVANEVEDENEDQSNFKLIQQEAKSSVRSKGSWYWHNRTEAPQGANSKFFIEKQQLSFEVDYDVFESRFWPKIAARRSLKKISPTLVWTEIYSVIKGGSGSCYYYQGYLPKSQYVKTEGAGFLDYNERRLIYFIFLEYEKWKAEQRAYDFMDVVNHLQKRLWYGDTLRRMQIDYLMVDEVQDLTPKTLEILLKLTSHKVFFAGDTAQTIAKGVGARFLDLRQIFVGLDFKVPQIVQLTKNYRSHGRILDLANSVVSLIELLFPKTIDKLVKEESELDGLKPLVIMPLDQFHMRTFFTGTAVTSANGGTIAAPQFGCNQVLIVRDQMAKEQVPEVFRNLLCLTVYEAKGLEFDDVILYNFFHLGDVAKSQWKLLNDVELEEVQKVHYDDELLDFDTLDAEKVEEFMKQLKKQERGDDVKYETELQLKLKKQRDEVYRKFSMLCIEMKFLYVAITRPKRRLIIYDDSADGRKPIQQYWERCGVVEVVTKDMIQHPETLSPRVRDIFMSGEMVSERSSQDQWRLQGIKLFKKKYYDAAVKCFQNSGDEELVLRCQAYQEADLGTAKAGEADSMAWRAKEIKQISKTEKRKLMKEAKKERLLAKRHFESAGFLFERIKMLRHAASCFFTAKNYVKAGEIFESLGHFGQAAECFMQIEELSKAARLYEQAKLVTKAIECHESAGDWEQLLHCLHRNKDFFKPEERQALINKYVPVALNSLYKLYSQAGEDGEEDGDEDNRGKLQEMKIKLKYQKKVAVIAEEDDEEEDSEGETEEPEEDAIEEAKEEATEQNAQEAPQQEVKEESEVSKEQKEGEEASGSDSEIEVIEEEYDLLDEIFQLKKHKSQKEEEQKQAQQQQLDQSSSSSFDVIDTSSSKLQLKGKEVKKEEEKEEPEAKEEAAAIGGAKEDFEHLSQYDPEDEFLRSSKSISIIDSILSGNHKSLSRTSDFSIVTSAKSKRVESLMSSAHSVAVVESNRDIYAEDVITQKIIYYISLFSEDVSDHLQKIRSKKILFSNNVSAERQEELFILDLDDIDAQFVNLILDVLEYYELFRLCLMLCNRYHLSDRLGRYLVSVCSKYSNLHLHRFNIKLLRNQTALNEMWLAKQRLASIVAHTALHNVFTLLEPAFLGVKQLNEPLNASNSLGMDTYRTMLDLGFWKKLVYIGVDSRAALLLCYKFFDRANFELLSSMLEVAKDEKEMVEWKKQTVLREFWLSVYSSIRDIKGGDKAQTTALQESLQHFDSLPEVKSEYGEQLASFSKLYKWLYLPQRQITDFVKPGQKIISQDQENKLREKVAQLDDDENYEVYELMQKEGVFDPKDQSWVKRFMSMSLCALPGTQHFQKFLRNVRNGFDKEGVEQLITTYTKCIQVLNLEREEEDIDLVESLLSVFLVSSAHEPGVPEEHSLFKHYRESELVLVNVNSALLKDIVQLQASMDAAQMNAFMAKKLAELRPRYFQVKNFRTAFIKEYKDFIAQFNQKKAFMQEKQLSSCFIVDMDSQFLMVPRHWVTKLVIIKLLSLCISLANELKYIQTDDFNKEQHHEEEGKKEIEDEVECFEVKIDRKLTETATIQRVNALTFESKVLHEPYSENIEKMDSRLMEGLKKNLEFAQLIQSYRQKIQFNSIRFNAVSSNAQRQYMSPLLEVTNELHLTFDFGILYKRRPIRNVNEIIKQGILMFRNAVNFENEGIDLNQEEEDPVMRERLCFLLISFAHFMIIDEYELMLELIKSELKTQRARPMSEQSQKDVGNLIWLLQKFMIALDIHFYLKKGSISNACQSIFDFINAFSRYLNYQEKIKLLSSAFFMLSVAKFQSAYLPDYALRFLDFGFKLHTYYDQECMEADVLSKAENYDRDNEDKCPFEEEERLVIEKLVDNIAIEKIDGDALYLQALQMILKILEAMNKDERSAFYKAQYIQIFNILITSAVNDTKKSTKTIDLLSKGFELIANSSYDEYFQLRGLLDFNYSNAIGFNEIQKQFKECESEYKHQFFAASKFGGHMVAYIDVKKCQTAQSQKEIKTRIDIAFAEEAKKVASHLYLGMLLKRKIRQKRHFYLAIKRAKENFSFEDRSLSMQINIDKMLPIERMPTRQILELLNLIKRKHNSLRQLIVCKYAVNSLDTHYILAKANELQSIFESLLKVVISYIESKGRILSEFEEVESQENELTEAINYSRLRYLEIDSEINTWMLQKSEPNLIEVERRNCKFKIKWESLKIYDKKAKLKALTAKMQEITSAQ